MAVKRTTKQNIEPVKKTPAQLRQENEKLQAELEKVKSGAYCYMCGKFLSERNFYMSTDPNVKTGLTGVCRKCAYELACPKDDEGNQLEPTKATVMAALEYLDKPFLLSVWDGSYHEWQSGKKNNIWTAYIKTVTSFDQYKSLRWKDGDIFRTNTNLGKLDAALPSHLEEEEIQKEKSLNDEIWEKYENNKRTVIEIVGYDPFADYPVEEDKPFLYSTLDSMIDTETKEDGMKMRAVIQIVQTHNQIDKINKYINDIVTDASSLAGQKALGSLKSYTDIVKKLVDSSNALAKDNGISVNHNNNKSKGASTLSGKIKLLTNIGYRDALINTFDYETCEGIRQVAELSEEARHKQIGYDENIAQEIKDIKVDLVEKLTKERDAALESLRILLVENIDLKQFLESKGLIDENGQVIKS